MLRGRGAEQAAVDALLGEARKGASGALIIRGEPGIGKTALLEYAASQSAGLRMLRGAGIESEAELPFAGLHLLLKPVLDRLDALPAPQRRALAGAFGMAGGGSGSGDRFMIGAGVLSLLADVAESEPLLCLVDDAQWLDRASAEALLFAARRLDREGVAILFATREYAGALAAGGISELRLEGLPAEAAAELLAGTSLPAAVRDQLVAEARGNPLALLELPPLLAERGEVAASAIAPLPLTSRVLDAFHHQVRSLPARAQTLLLVAAADDTGDLSVLLRAAGSLGAGAADLQPAEERGLVTAAGDVALAFRHPLIRAAVYHGAPLVQRIAVHQALAAAYGSRDADRRAWHLAAAAAGRPSEEAAAELESAAGRAAARTGFAAAAAAYDRAARLSPDASAAARRQTLACEAGLQGGQLDWARARAERVYEEASPALRLRLIDVRAGADFAGGALGRAHELLVSGADLVAGEDPGRACWMLLEAVHATWALPTDLELMAATVDRLNAVPLAADDPLRSLVWLVRWGTSVALERSVAGFAPLAEVMPAARAAAAASAAGPRGLLRVGTMAFATGQDEFAADVATSLVAGARADGTIYALPGGLGHLALVQVLLGRHREARISGAEAIRIARDTAQPLWVGYTSGALAYLAAIEGDEAACRSYAADAGERESAPSAGGTWGRAALALLDLGAGRVREAYDRLQAIVSGPTRHQGAVIRCVPDHVEAAVRLGLSEEVAGRVAAFAAWAATMQLPWIDALLARCQALTAPDASAEEHYLRALSLDGRPFERARTALLYGEWLRRSRRKADAREQLDLALKAFEELGCAPWAARTRAEMGALGGALPSVAASDVFAGLTPQELQITQLAAQGLSNRDIAAQLFLSPRTVAYHLYKAYPKLGITSRGELAALTRS